MYVWTSLLNDLSDTGFPEYLAVITGILSVWFARKENILTFPVGIVSVLIYVYLCYHAGLYADMGINSFYFVMSLYGWYNWGRNVKQTQMHIPISRLGWKRQQCRPGRLLLIYSLTLFSLSGFTLIIYYLLTHYTDSTVPFWDALTTALFIIGMWLMAIKKIENWIVWIIGDAFCVFLFYQKGLALSAFQYIVFLFLAVSGYLEWRRMMKQTLPA